MKSKTGRIHDGEVLDQVVFFMRAFTQRLVHRVIPAQMTPDREPHQAENVTLSPGEYLPLRVMASPQEASESVPYPLHGTREASTVAYLFQYNFDIVVAPNLSAIHDLDVNGQKITVYPPFKSRPIDPRFVQCMPLSNVPHRPNAAPPDDQWLIASKLMAQVRSQTSQWWINRGREHSRDHIRHWFEGNELGERLGGVGAFAFFYGPMGFERPLDDNIWNAVAQALAQGKDSSLSWDICLDAIYFHSADDLRRSILELAISNEILLAEILERWALQRRLERVRIAQVLQGNNYLSHLGRAGQLWDRSFQRDHPVEFDWIKAAWVARGRIAHGGAPLAQENQLLTLNDMPSMFASALLLRKWLEII